MEASEICTIEDLRPLMVQCHRAKFIEMDLSRSTQGNGYNFNRLRFRRFCFIILGCKSKLKKIIKRLKTKQRNESVCFDMSNAYNQVIRRKL
ncbi:unnamed protein product [Paramecium octaurelia]|uniref:Uncharacterized protein n=1 Tax=Paramecium octaurelia TaxID=43137 RepID=A0A8S1YRG1_PAROT|nr:unnamed protein product [Paramecium octaurelia]